MKTIVKELPHHKLGLSYTATGYGSKIPTKYMVQKGNRFYRVYCWIYSNTGTLYYLKDKKLITINEHDLEVSS